MPAGGKRLASLEILRLPLVLGGGREQELAARAARTAQSEATESEDALEMGEQNLSSHNAEAAGCR